MRRRLRVLLLRDALLHHVLLWHDLWWGDLRLLRQWANNSVHPAGRAAGREAAGPYAAGSPARRSLIAAWMAPGWGLNSVHELKCTVSPAKTLHYVTRTV